jgi:type II secretory pathway component PulC
MPVKLECAVVVRVMRTPGFISVQGRSALNSDWIRYAVIVALALAIAVRAVWLGTVLLQTANGGGAAHLYRVAEVKAGASSPDADLRRVLGAHLFGTLAASDPDSGGSVAQWVLSGTLVSSTPERGWAILGETRQSPRLRAAGQDIGENFKLVQVFADHVALEHRGQRLILNLTHSRALAGAGNTLVTGVADNGGTAVPHPRYPPNRPPAWVAVAPQPYLSDDGSYVGMRVIGAGPAVYRMGLKPNDVVTYVNGRAIDGADATRQALQELSNGAPAIATILRDGATLEVPLTFSTAGS